MQTVEKAPLQPASAVAAASALVAPAHSDIKCHAFDRRACYHSDLLDHSSCPMELATSKHDHHATLCLTALVPYCCQNHAVLSYAWAVMNWEAVKHKKTSSVPEDAAAAKLTRKHHAGGPFAQKGSQKRAQLGPPSRSPAHAADWQN